MLSGINMTILIETFVAGIICSVLAWFYDRIKTKQFRVFVFLITPLIVSILLYWAPNINKMNNPEYQAWAPLSYGFFYVGGFLGSGLCCALKSLIFKNR